MRRRHLGLLAFFLVGTIALTWPLALHLGVAIPGDSFDGWQNYWNLWWVRMALLDQHSHPYITDALYHPSGVSLWFQTLNMFNGLASLPVQLAGNLYLAYNAVVYFSFAIAGYGAALLAAWVLHRSRARPGPALWAAATLAGVVYTFAPFHFAHLLGHMQVFSLQWIPFYVLYLLRAVEPRRHRTGSPLRTASPDRATGRRRGRDALLAGLFLFLSVLCDWYFGLYLALFTLLYLGWLLARRRLRLAQLGAAALAAGVAVAAATPVLLPMVAESLRYDFMRPPPGQIVNLSADVLAFIVPSIQHPLWGEWAGRLRAGLPASPSENTLYAGLAPVVLAAYGLARRRLALGFWALATLAFAVFALGPILHVGGRAVTLPGGQPLPLPYALLLRLPFVEIARTVARYDLMVMLGLGVLAAGGLYTLLERDGPKSTSRTSSGVRIWGAAAIVVVMFEFLPAPYPISPPDTPAWYYELAADERSGAVLNLPMNWDRPGYLLYQTVHGRPLTAGYISREDPRTYPYRVPILSDFRNNAADINAVDPALYAPTILQFLDIHWVVIDRYKMPGGIERAHTDALVSAMFGQRQPVYADERITVYETWAPDQPLPWIELGYEWGPPGPTGRAAARPVTLIVHSPDAFERTLAILPAEGAAPALGANAGPAYWLYDGGAQPLSPLADDLTRWRVALAPGPNAFALAPLQPDLHIQRLSLEP